MNPELMDQKLNNSYETLSKTTFSNNCYAVDRENDLKASHFCLKPNSAYMKFLQQLGKAHLGIEKYRTQFETIGTISPRAVGHIIMNSQGDN